MPDSPLYNMLLLNDDVTPIDFVVDVLQRLIGLDHDAAIKLMLRIHHEGNAICGRYSLEEAEAMMAGVLAFAAEHNHPLKCVIEEAR